MRCLLFGLGLVVLTTAKPELYREKEDFQYSRSSSDEGTKSGYYDAQRGNMGGNYERAHNMDNLAQHQMGGLIKQVQGELGDGSSTKTGNVFTSANSQGIYGSGRYDLSSLGNRNFQDSEHSESQSSTANRAYQYHSSSNQNNARYSSNSLSHNSGYSQNRGSQSDNLQQAQNLYGGGEYEHGSQSGRSSRFYTQSGYQGVNDNAHSSLNQQASSDFGADAHHRQSQARIVVRPGTSVVIPISAQATQGTRTASYYDQHTNSESEALNTGGQQTVYVPVHHPSPKHYESSYSYRKQWEKHDTKPVVVPLSTYQIPVNSELYDSSRVYHGSQFENTNAYNQASTQARHHADYDAQQHLASAQQQIASSQQQIASLQQQTASSRASSSSNSDAFAQSNLNAFSQSGYNADANSQSEHGAGSISTKPKSYHSSYSYHKSWERQGDPYVIKPSSNGAIDAQTSQRLTDLSSQNQYSSQHYGSRHTKSQSYSMNDCVVECDPLNSHVRVGRSVNEFQEQNQNTFDGQETQQSQTAWQNLELGGQQTQNKWDNLEDLGQQTQNKWEDLQDLGQQTQNKFDNLEDLGQQTQNSFQNLEDLGQQTQNSFQNLEDLGQQTQTKWENLENFGQQTQDLGQQTQDLGQQLQDFGQQTQDFGQQTQDLGQQLHDFGQQRQDFGQQTQNNQQLQNFGQETQDFGQQTQDLGQQLQDFGQQTQDFGQQSQDFGQQTQNFKQLQNFGQETQDIGQLNKNQLEAGQETQSVWNKLESFGQQSGSLDDQKPGNWDKQEKAMDTQPEAIEEFGQQTQNKWTQLEDQNTEIRDKGMEQTQTSEDKGVFYWDKINEQSQDVDNLQHHSSGQQTQNKWDSVEGLGQQTQNKWEDFGQQTQAGWDHVSSLNKDNALPKDFDNNQSPLFNPPDKQHSDKKPIHSLWDKIDNLDDEYVPPSNKNGMNIQNNYFSQSQSSNHDLQQQDSFDLFTISTTPKQEKQYNTMSSSHHKNNRDKNIDQIHGETTEKLKTTTQGSFITKDILTSTTEKVKPKRPNDVGRGDIGPDDLLDDVSSSTTKKSNYSFYENTSTPSTQHSFEILTTTLKSNTHKIEIEEIPQDITQTFTAQNTQDGSEIIENHNTFYHNQEHEQKHTKFEDVIQKSDSWGQQSHSLSEKQTPELYNHNNFHNEGDNLQEAQFVDFSQQNHQSNEFYHHGQASENSHKYDYHHQDMDVDQQNMQSHGWESHQNHGFQHESHYFHQSSYHHQHGFHDEHKDQQNPGWQSFDHGHPYVHHYNKDQEQSIHPQKIEELSDTQQQSHYSQQQNTEQQLIDLQQNLQSNVEQRNTDQFLDDFSQLNQELQSHNHFNDFEQKNVEDLQDFQQHEKKADFEVLPLELNEGQQQEDIENFATGLEVEQVKQNKDLFSTHPQIKPQILQINDDDSHQIKKHEDGLSAAPQHDVEKTIIISPPEPTTEKPGFWKSVGNKFSSAKNKVASWFGS